VPLLLQTSAKLCGWAFLLLFQPPCTQIAHPSNCLLFQSKQFLFNGGIFVCGVHWNLTFSIYYDANRSSAAWATTGAWSTLPISSQSRQKKRFSFSSGPATFLGRAPVRQPEKKFIPVAFFFSGNANTLVSLLRPGNHSDSIFPPPGPPRKFFPSDGTSPLCPIGGSTFWRRTDPRAPPQGGAKSAPITPSTDPKGQGEGGALRRILPKNGTRCWPLS